MLPAARSDNWLKILAFTALILGVLFRCYRAATMALNPDEALHLLPCYAGSLAETLKLLGEDAHPPLFIVLNCLLRPLLFAEFTARLLPVAAGALLPMVLYFWLRARCGTLAGCVALIWTALAPGLVDLTAELRSYSLALLLATLVLFWLDRGIESLQPSRLVFAGIGLCLAITTEYSLAILCPAIALYGFARLYEISAERPLWFTWTGCLLFALAVCAHLVWFHIRPHPESLSKFSVTWLANGFPAPQQAVFDFIPRAVFAQFLFATNYARSSMLFALLFLFALLTCSNTWRILLAAPFATGLAFALLRFFPFGPTRHSILVDIVIAAGLGLAASKIFPSGSRLRVFSSPFALVLAILLGLGNRPHARPGQTDRQAFREAASYLSALAASGHPILATGEAYHTMNAYCGMQRRPRVPLSQTPQWDLPSGMVEAQFAVFRRRHYLPAAEPVLFLEGGFGTFDFPEPKPTSPTRTFGTLRLWTLNQYGLSGALTAPR